MVPNGIQNHVVTLRASCEILLRVINDPLCADGSDHPDVPCSAYTGNLRAERFRDLYCKGTNSSRRTVNQNRLARLDPPLVAQPLQCGQCRNRHRSRFLKRDVLRIHLPRCFGSTRILGEGSLARAEHRVTWLELRYASANRFNLPGHINPQPLVLGPAQPRDYAKEVRETSHKVPVIRIDGRRTNFYQDLIIAGGRLFNFFTLENIG